MIVDQIFSNRHSRRYFATPAGVLLLVALFCIGMWAQPSHPSSAPVKAVAPAAVASAQSATTPQLTAVDLEAFLDGMMPAQLEREDIAGAVIAVVKDGQVIFAKGYGYSDMAKRTPVTPDATLFRPGSTSKLFTWTSVMQLVEQGKLDLNRDVNDYLDFKIPPAFGKPITLRNIMTHTAGFEEVVKDLFVADAQHMGSLEYYVKNHIPARIFPPGTVPAYSNYATALAGYIVQRVSGKPFEQYVAENIYIPLEMKRSTFVQPLPEDLKPLMSKGYTGLVRPQTVRIRGSVSRRQRLHHRAGHVQLHDCPSAEWTIWQCADSAPGNRHADALPALWQRRPHERDGAWFL